MLTTTGVVDLRPQKVCVSLLGRPKASGAACLPTFFFLVLCVCLELLYSYFFILLYLFYLFVLSILARNPVSRRSRGCALKGYGTGAINYRTEPVTCNESGSDGYRPVQQYSLLYYYFTWKLELLIY
jgi:hypothetical protein